jgi:uncharacterized membrane protein
MTEPDAAPDDDETPRELAVFTAERAKAFVDAVVAIAMTLLILPLLESVREMPEQTAEKWLAEHDGQIISFLISFVVVAMFWIGHHRMFARVERVTVPLLWLLVLWMATIVWLPVSTALSGTGRPNTPTLYLLYIGGMLLTSLTDIAIRLLLRAQPTLHEIPRRAMLRGLSADILMAVLFVVALVLAITTPLGYYALFLLVLIGPGQAIVVRLIHAERPRAAR